MARGLSFCLDKNQQFHFLLPNGNGKRLAHVVCDHDGKGSLEIFGAILDGEYSGVSLLQNQSNGSLEAVVGLKGKLRHWVKGSNNYWFNNGHFADGENPSLAQDPWNYPGDFELVYDTNRGPFQMQRDNRIPERPEWKHGKRLEERGENTPSYPSATFSERGNNFEVIFFSSDCKQATHWFRTRDGNWNLGRGIDLSVESFELMGDYISNSGSKPNPSRLVLVATRGDPDHLECLYSFGQEIRIWIRNADATQWSPGRSIRNETDQEILQDPVAFQVSGQNSEVFAAARSYWGDKIYVWSRQFFGGDWKRRFALLLQGDRYEVIR